MVEYKQNAPDLIMVKELRDLALAYGFPITAGDLHRLLVRNEALGASIEELLSENGRLRRQIEELETL